jgi:hypothetical protein
MRGASGGLFPRVGPVGSTPSVSATFQVCSTLRQSGFRVFLWYWGLISYWQGGIHMHCLGKPCKATFDKMPWEVVRYGLQVSDATA